ncbi:hypothetical protein CASFOL_035877 [Castilleja foliolosa]|uniref:Uncharacterized protein n=1 Tax=Castilleja foliolosa TaxID=1961234 RepID=A0ABD3BW86_9LAMI
MDRYQKVEKPKLETPVNENEIRITSQGLVRNYISYATSLLQLGEKYVGGSRRRLAAIWAATALGARRTEEAKRREIWWWWAAAVLRSSRRKGRGTLSARSGGDRRQAATDGFHDDDDEILSSDDVKFGYNAATDRYEDLMAARIIDPSKVVRCCLEHAVSVARTFLIADAVVVEIKEPMPKLPRFMKNPMPTSGVGPLNPLGDQNKRINPSSFGK